MQCGTAIADYMASLIRDLPAQVMRAGLPACQSLAGFVPPAQTFRSGRNQLFTLRLLRSMRLLRLWPRVSSTVVTRRPARHRLRGQVMEKLMTTAERIRGELHPPILNDHEAAMTKAAQRCLMAALDHSRAKAIALIDESGDVQSAPVLELPPAALRVIAQVLGAMGDQRPIMVIPRNLELTTVDAANFLNVSRPFVVKEIEAGRLKHRKVGTHRRIEYADLVEYRDQMRSAQRSALEELARDSQELGLE